MGEGRCAEAARQGEQRPQGEQPRGAPRAQDDPNGEQGGQQAVRIGVVLWLYRDAVYPVCVYGVAACKQVCGAPQAGADGGGVSGGGVVNVVLVRRGACVWRARERDWLCYNCTAS